MGVVNVWDKDADVSILVAEASGVTRVAYIATSGQKIFSMPAGVTYTPGINNLKVYVNGQNKWPGVSDDYVETSSTAFTFNYGLSAGELVHVEIGQFISGLTSVPASQVLLTSGQTLQNYIGNRVINIKDAPHNAITGDMLSDLAALVSAYSLIPSTGGIIFFPAGVYEFEADTTALETNWLNLSAGLTTHVCLEMTKSNVKFVGEKGAILKLKATNKATEVSYLFGNSKDTPLSNIEFHGLSFDLDKTANAAAADRRGILAVNITNFHVDRSCTFYSSSAKGGYSVETYNCTTVTVDFYAYNISGGYNSIYSKNIYTDLILDGFNEGVDLDKVNFNCHVKGTFINGGECLDSNATLGLKANIVAKDCGRILTIDGKGLFADDFVDHVADINKVFNPSYNIEVNMIAINCAYSISTPSVVIGNAWVDLDHSGVDPVKRIKLSGSLYKVGYWNIKEGVDLDLSDLQIEDVLAPLTVSGEWGAISARSEDDWVTYPGAQTKSDLKISFNNFKLRNSNRHGVYIDYPGQVDMSKVDIDITSQEAGSVDAGVKISHIEKRNAIINIDGLKCSNGYDGLVLDANAGATCEINLNKLDLTRGNSNVDLRILDGAEYIIAERVTIHFGTIAAGTNDQRALYQLQKAGKILDAKLFNSSDITQDDSNYSTYTLARKDADGTNSQQIVAANTKLTGGIDVNSYAPVSLGQATIIADADSVFISGQLVTLDKTDTGTGQPSDEMKVILDFIPY